MGSGPAAVRDLSCDILLTVHPGFADMEGKRRRQKEEPGSQPFVDPKACRAYADGAGERLDQRVAEEGKTRAPRAR